MARFRILAGIYVERAKEDGIWVRKIWRKGQVVESNKPLDTKFVNKFRRLDLPPAAPSIEESKPQQFPEKPTPQPQLSKTSEAAPEAEEDNLSADASEPEKIGGPSTETEDLGDDHTKHFYKAAEAGAKVFKNGKKYKVVDADTLEALHDDAFTTKKDVEAKLKTLINA